MIKSMTSFARVSLGSQKDAWTVEMRSLNHRYFDFSLRIPQELAGYETKIRELVQTVIKRGKVTLMISRSGDAEGNFRLDEDALKQYLKTYQKLKKDFKLAGALDAVSLLSLPNLFTTKLDDKKKPQADWKALANTIHKVLKKTTSARNLEGRKIAKDVQKRLDHIQRTSVAIEKLAKDRAQINFKNLKQKVAKLIDDSKLDEERLYREVALVAERTDITEELVRLQSHLELFQKRIRQKGEMGRELDFLCQEMNREINTLGAKAQHFGISQRVIELKGELEKIREQIQNVE